MLSGGRRAATLLTDSFELPPRGRNRSRGGSSAPSPGSASRQTKPSSSAACGLISRCKIFGLAVKHSIGVTKCLHGVRRPQGCLARSKAPFPAADSIFTAKPVGIFLCSVQDWSCRRQLSSDADTIAGSNQDRRSRKPTSKVPNRSCNCVETSSVTAGRSTPSGNAAKLGPLGNGVPARRHQYKPCRAPRIRGGSGVFFERMKQLSSFDDLIQKVPFLLDSTARGGTVAAAMTRR